MEQPFNVTIITFTGNVIDNQKEFNILSEIAYGNYDDALKAYNAIKLNSFNQHKAIIKDDVVLIATFEN